MNDEALEALVRSRLRSAAPRVVPASLVLRAAAIPHRGGAAPTTGRVPGPAPRARWLAVMATAVVTVVVAGWIVAPRPSPAPDAGSPAIPTLPPVTQPSLPPGVARPTPIRAGAWVTPEAAWLVDDQDRLRLTTDGGQTWSEPRPLPRPLDELRGGPTFDDASTGYATWTEAADRVAIWVGRTYDGGRTWTSSEVGALPSQAADPVSATVHFSDDRHGIVLAGVYEALPVPSAHAGAGLQAKACGGWTTSDGGAGWAALPGAPCSDHDEWATPTTGILIPAADGGPEVSLTLDGGLTWHTGTVPDTGVGDAPLAVVFTVAPDGTPRLAYRVDRAGAAAPAGVIVAESRDGGGSWRTACELEPSAGLAVGTVTALGPDHWLATGSSAPGSDAPRVPILETADGGRTWSNAGTMGSIDGRSLGWYDRFHGMATGQDDSGCALRSGTPCHVDGFFLTNDGGQTWHGVPF